MENLVNRLEKVENEANSIISSIEKDIMKKSSILEIRLKQEKINILDNQKRALDEMQREVYRELQKELKELERLYNDKRREIQNFDLESASSEFLDKITMFQNEF